MPITKERKKLYPKDWKEIRNKIVKRAKGFCELCGVKNKSIICRNRDNPATYIYDYDEDFLLPIKVVLTVHHINNDPTDNRDYNLLALCQRCHCKLDAPFKIKKKRNNVFKEDKKND